MSNKSHRRPATASTKSSLYPPIDLHDKLLNTQHDNTQLKLQLHSLKNAEKLNKVKIAKLSKQHKHGNSIVHDIDSIAAELMSQYNTTQRTQSNSTKRSHSNKGKKSTNNEKSKSITISQPMENNENVNYNNTQQSFNNTVQSTPQPTITVHTHSDTATDLVPLKLELREKHTQILVLQQQYNTLQQQYRHERNITQQQKSMLLQLQADMEQKQETIKIQQTNTNLLSDAQLQCETLNSIIADLKSDNTALKQRCDLLTKSMFDCDGLEATKISTLTAEYQNEISTLKQKLSDKETKLNEFRSTLQSSIDNLKLQQSQLNLLQQAKNDSEIQCAQLTEQLTQANEKLAMFTVDNGIELSELEQALTLIRRNKSELSTVNTKSANNSELELLNKQLRTELNSVREQLNVQLQLNAQQKQQYDVHKRNLLHHVQNTHTNLDDSMFEMSDIGDMNELSTIIAINISHAVLNKTHYIYTTTYKSTEPITFIVIDFYDYESSVSKLNSGYKPVYDMLTQWCVTMDPMLLKYLETESINITMYTMSETMKHIKIGTGKITLKSLLTPSAGEKNAIKLYCTNINDNSDIVAELQYVLKIQRPILSVPPTPQQTTPRKKPLLNVQNPSTLQTRAESVQQPNTAPFVTVDEITEI